MPITPRGHATGPGAPLGRVSSGAAGYGRVYTLADNRRQDSESYRTRSFSGGLRVRIANVWLYDANLPTFNAFEGPSPHAYLSIFGVGTTPLPVLGVDPVPPLATFLQAVCQRVGTELLERVG